MKRSRIVILLLVGVCLAGALGVGGYFYKQQQRAAWDAKIVNELKARYPNEERERMLAEIYWSRYPDVRADPYFGKGGRLGNYGAREHYRRHGDDVTVRMWPKLN